MFPPPYVSPRRMESIKKERSCEVGKRRFFIHIKKNQFFIIYFHDRLSARNPIQKSVICLNQRTIYCVIWMSKSQIWLQISRRDTSLTNLYYFCEINRCRLLYESNADGALRWRWDICEIWKPLFQPGASWKIIFGYQYSVESSSFRFTCVLENFNVLSF